MQTSMAPSMAEAHVDIVYAHLAAHVADSPEMHNAKTTPPMDSHPMDSQSETSQLAIRHRVNPDVQECVVFTKEEEAGQSLPAIHPITSWLSKSGDQIALSPCSSSQSNQLKSLTYMQLHQILDDSPRFASPAEGGRVALLFPVHESPQLAVAMLSALHRGCSVAPLDPRLLGAGSSALVSSVRQLRCSIALVSQSLFDQAKEALQAEGMRVYTCGQIQDSEIGRLTWNQEAVGNVPTSAPDKDPQLLLTSSGTTGAPKVVPVRGSSLLHNARCLAASLNLSSSDHALNAMPLFHIGGIACPLFATLVAGARLTQLDSVFDPAEFVALLENQDLAPTWYYAAPTLHRAILMTVEAQGRGPLSTSLRFVRSGAAHLPSKDAVALERLFGCSVMTTYSMSECMPVCSVPPDWRPSSEHKADTVGRPIGPSLRIADADTGDALPYGVAGEVMIRGPGVCTGYEGLDSSSAFVSSSDGQRWFRTGDLGMMDRDGFVFLRGRARDVVKRGGEQVSLHEVDEALRSAHPEVAMAVAFPVPNDFWGEEVAAAVVLKRPGAATAQELLLAVRGRLEEFKLPRQLVLLDSDARLPKTASGKHKRFEIAAALGVRAVDLAAAEALAATVVPAVEEEPAKEEVFRPNTKALYGFRFLLAYWVCQFHIGLQPTQEWAQVQAFSMNISGFMLLAGFLLTTSTTEPIRPEERRGFWVSRVSAAHGCFLFSILYALPSYFLTVHPSPSLFVADFVLSLFAILPWINNVLWFQGVYYQLVVLFPFIDSLYHKMSYYTAWACTMSMLAVASVILRFVPPLARFSSISWVWLFAASVGMAHLFRRGWAPLDEAKRRFWVKVWGASTDLISVAWLALAVVVAMEDEWEDDTFEAYREDAIRMRTYLAEQIGYYRAGTPLLALWAYGLAASDRSFTARLFSNDFLVEKLSPLSMPIYMLHVPTAVYIYLLKEGSEPTGDYQVPLEWYWVPVVFVISALIGHMFNELINPIVFPYVMAWNRLIFDVVLGALCCGFGCLSQPPCPLPPAEEGAASKDVEEGLSMEAKVERVVVQTIRRVTGTTADFSSGMKSIGLDSFGATALCGALRGALPLEAKGLRPGEVAVCETVGDLIGKLCARAMPEGPTPPNAMP